jgi:adenosylcobyric acid synthase
MTAPTAGRRSTGRPTDLQSGLRGGLRGGLMVCGTSSNAGKSTLVAGLCRLLARRGVRVAPFKSQNMANNSVVTRSGHEIGRAQGVQAWAAGIEPEVAMNPILLKPTGERSSQVVVMGRPHATMSATEYHEHKPALLDTALDALADLRGRFDVVLLEGAGSPAEINLLDRDIVNLRLARRAGVPAIVVGDIDVGGVFAALYGTVALLPDDLRSMVGGFVVNKLRGDPALLLDGFADLERRCGVPTLGVLPWLAGAAIDAEDSLALDEPHEIDDDFLDRYDGDVIDVAVIRFPRISNFTDLDPLHLEPTVQVRLVHDAAGLGRPDLIILPGTKATLDDLGWLRRRRLDDAIVSSDATLFGVCGGYQMLGDRIEDGVESATAVGEGLDRLPVTTRFGAEKVTRRRHGRADGHEIDGYQIHHGRVEASAGDPFVELDPIDDSTEAPIVDGVRVGAVAGTTLHGLFENDRFREGFLHDVARRSGKRFAAGGLRFEAVRQARFDRLADALEAHLDLARIDALIATAADRNDTTAALT